MLHLTCCYYLVFAYTYSMLVYEYVMKQILCATLTLLEKSYITHQ